MATGAASGGADSSELKQIHLLPETDDEVGRDSAFLNDMDQVFEKYSSKTSKLFIPFLCQFKDT